MENINENFKSGFVTIIGRPNVGKSTLMNKVLGQKIAITSSKPQTTRNRIQTVYTDDNAQIVFVDTPGIHKAKNKLGEYMVTAAESTLNEVDAICFLVEPTTHIGAAERHIAEILSNVATPVILVINKIDTVKPNELLKVIDEYKDLAEFKEIVPVSAMTGENVEDMLAAICKYLDEGPMYYDPETVTDQMERQIAAELIREKALRNLNDEIPHGIAVLIERMKERPKGNITDIDASIVCERESHKRIVIGKNGSLIKKIGIEARKEIEEMLDCKVNLKLWVKVRKDWRSNENMVRSFGYDKKKL